MKLTRKWSHNLGYGNVCPTVCKYSPAKANHLARPEITKHCLREYEEERKIEMERM